MLGDFTGLGRFTRYKTDRQLSNEEKLAHDELASHRGKTEPSYALAVISMDEECLELVDRWYPQKGMSIAMAIPVLALCLYAIIPTILLALQDPNAMLLLLTFGVCVVFSAFFWLGWYGFRLEAFRLTHYPLLLDRVSGVVHAFKPEGSVIRSEWKELYFLIGEETIPAYGKTYDVRAHVLDKSTGRVKETFTLSYIQGGTKEETLRAWEFVRRYMEEPEQLESLCRNAEICLPIDGRREGAYFGILRTFALAGRYPLLQLLLSPIFSWITLCRWIAMYTSRVPQWPASVNSTKLRKTDHPRRKNWERNDSFGFIDGVWPVICFVAGWGLLLWGAISLASFFGG